jgi:hypothetical protein
MPKIIVLKCEELPSEEMTELCNVKTKLIKTGIGDIIVKIYGEVLDTDTFIIRELTKAQLDPSFISNVNNLLSTHRHEIVSTLLKEADVDIPVCTSTEDTGCITIKVSTKNETKRIAIYHIDLDGNYIKIYP